MTSDIRWHQRFNNYLTALDQLKIAVDLSHSRSLTDLEKQGIIQAFEFTHELAWNLIRDYFIFQGKTGITGSRDAAREAFQAGLIQDGNPWMEMIKSRNLTSHTYNKKVAEEIVEKILSDYFPAFETLAAKMTSLKSKNQ